MNVIVLKQLDAIEAQLELLKVQIAAVRHALTPVEPPAARVAVPAGCAAYPPDQCGRQNADAWIARGSFSAPHARRCRGCGEESSLGVN